MVHIYNEEGFYHFACFNPLDRERTVQICTNSMRYYNLLKGRKD